DAAVRVDRWAMENGVECLYLLVPSEDEGGIRAAEDSGFRLVEIRVALRRPPGPFPWKEFAADRSAVTVRRSRPGDLDALRRIAAHSFRDSRFWVDPNFPREKVSAFYATWIEQSTKGYQGNKVLVAEVRGRIAGFAAIANELGRVGRISLIAVDSEFL